MKKLLLLSALLFASSVFLHAQSWWKTERASGPVVKRTLQVDDFEGVALAFSGNVYLRQGNTQKVEVEMQESLFDYLNTRVRNGLWSIKFDRNIRTRERVNVYITVPTLREVYVSGSGNIQGETPFSNLDDVDISVSGSGDIVMDIEASMVKAGISGSGDIDLEGKARAIHIRISGSGDVTSHNLVAEEGIVSISGSGDATIHTTENLEVSISGSGDVAYRGRPRLSAKTSGSGDVEAM